MEKRPASKHGLTLIEVLIALIILSVGVSAMMMAMSRCLAVVRTARNRETAHALIQRVEIEFPITAEEIDETSETGTFDDTPGYTWQREVTMVDAEERPGLFMVTTRIEWSERGRDAFEEVTVYRYEPKAESVTSRT